MYRRGAGIRVSRPPTRIPAALLAAAAAVLAAPATSPAQDGGGDAATTLDGVFTAEQASRGEEIFSETCARCHPTSRFVGASFRPSWSRAPVSTLFTVLRTQMPFDNPGSLEPDEYAAVLAYIFQLNDLPAGDRELPASADSLRGYTIRFGGAGGADGDGGGAPRPRPPRQR